MANNRTRGASGARVPMAKLMPQIAKLRRQGMTVHEIAQKLGRSDRYIFKVLAAANAEGSATIVEVPDPKTLDSLPSEVADTIVFTPDGFEKFFNRYSNRILQPVHKKWVTDALSHHRVLINCPPRHAKSTIFSTWFPIWLIAMNRDVQILICSQTEDMARKFTNEISHNLTYNTKLIQDFGRFRPEMNDWPWRPAEGQLMVEGRRREIKSGDLTIQIRGARQQILGMEANWVIADDVVSRPNTRSEVDRENLSEWFHGDALSRLEPQGRALVIGQRLHLHDLYGELSEEKLPGSVADDGSPKKRWVHINYKAITDWDKQEVLWPTKWSWDEIMEKFHDLGTSRFEAMYQQNPLPESEALARRVWIYGDDQHPGCTDITRSLGWAESLCKNPVRVVSLDPSPTRYAGLLVAEIDWNPSTYDIHVLEIIREKMQVRDMLRHVERCIAWYSPQYLIFERNAAQRWLLQDPSMERLRRRIQVLAHDTGRNKGDPVLGIESLSVDFEFGRIHLPYGDPESKAQSELLIQEALQYPQAATDDLLMALWFIKFNYSKLIPRHVWSQPMENTGAFKIPPRLAKGF